MRRPYALVVSHLNPYKNLVEVVEAFGRARPRAAGGPLQLVLVGRRNHEAYYRRLVATVSRLGLAGDGRFLPPLEPDQGAPVACSSAGVMPEIGGDTVLYFDPWDVEDIARALVALAGDETLRRRLGAAARERARVFPDGVRVATDTIAILEAAGRCAAS